MKKRILDLDVTQKTAATEIGVTDSSLIKWMKGHAAPDLHRWPGVIEFLGYDPRPASDGFGPAIVRWRKGRGMSQRKLAAMLGVDPTTLARWERNERDPWPAARARAERLLGVTKD